MRDNYTTARDLAIIDLLVSTGMRVGEMVTLNRDDVNFEATECVVFGKGSAVQYPVHQAMLCLHRKKLTA